MSASVTQIWCHVYSRHWKKTVQVLEISVENLAPISSAYLADSIAHCKWIFTICARSRRLVSSVCDIDLTLYGSMSWQWRRSHKQLRFCTELSIKTDTDRAVIMRTVGVLTWRVCAAAYRTHRLKAFCSRSVGFPTGQCRHLFLFIYYDSAGSVLVAVIGSASPGFARP